MDIIALILGIIGAVASIWFIWDRLFPYKRVSWCFAEKSAKEITRELLKDNFIPTMIFGIGRGGAIMGSLISGALGHRPLCVIDRVYLWVNGRRKDDILFQTNFPPELLEKVLLIAGEVHAGNTMRKYFDYLKSIGAKDVRRATLIFEKGSTEPVEYKGLETYKDLRLPWMFTKNYLREDRRDDAEHRNVKKSISNDKRSIYIIRHGESLDNAAADKFSGITDVELSELGHMQAREIGKSLRNCSVSCIFTSQMRRARDTARTIQEYTGGEIYIENRLRELDYGDWEGLTKTEVMKKFPTAFNKWTEDPMSNTPSGGESATDALSRIYSFWKEIENRMVTEQLDDIVVVSHKTVIRLLLSFLQEFPLEDYRSMNIPNASVIKVSFNERNMVQIEKWKKY